MPTRQIALILISAVVLTACSGRIGTTVAQECKTQLRLAEQELDDAKVKGFSGSIQWTKAAGLVVSATTQQQLERYESCLDKARRARTYLREAQK